MGNLIQFFKLNMSSLALTSFQTNLGETTSCNRSVDLDCNGVIESWERANEIPRIVFGVFAMMFSASSLYIVLANRFWYNYNIAKLETFQSAAGLINLILSVFTAMPLFFMWLATYSNSLDVIDAYYVFSYVNTWYYASIFWIVQILWWLSVSKRNSSSEILPDTYKDHSLTISVV